MTIWLVFYLSCIWKIALSPRREWIQRRRTNSLNFKSDRRGKETINEERKMHPYPDLGREKRFSWLESEEGWKINSTTFGSIHVVAQLMFLLVSVWRDAKTSFPSPSFFSRKRKPLFLSQQMIAIRKTRDKVIALCKFNHSSLWVKWAVLIPLISETYAVDDNGRRRSFLEIDKSCDSSHSLFSSSSWGEADNWISSDEWIFFSLAAQQPNVSPPSIVSCWTWFSTPFAIFPSFHCSNVMTTHMRVRTK